MDVKKDDSAEEIKEFYVIGVLHRSHPVAIGGQEIAIPLAWADGMVGVFPIFGDFESAKKYAPDGSTIDKIRMRLVKPN